MAYFSLTDTYRDYFENNKVLDTFSRIKSLNNQNSGFGKGATRHYINHIFNDLIKNKVILLNGYYFYFNKENDYLNTTKHMKKFCQLMKITIASEGTIPFHLPPHILENILGPMERGVLEFFYEKMYPSISKSMESTEYESTCKELGYSTSETYMRDHMLKYSVSHDWLFCSFLKQTFRILEEYYGHHIDFDLKISGEFQLTPNMIINNTAIEQKYEKLWCEFVNGLTSSELSDMLYYFTNSKSHNGEIKVIVESNSKLDIKVETCFNTVYISHLYFRDIKSMKKLKKLWVNSATETDALYDDSATNTPRRNSNMHVDPVTSEETVSLYDYFNRPNTLNMLPPRINHTYVDDHAGRNLYSRPFYNFEEIATVDDSGGNDSCEDNRDDNDIYYHRTVLRC